MCQPGLATGFGRGMEITPMAYIYSPDLLPGLHIVPRQRAKVLRRFPQTGGVTSRALAANTEYRKIMFEALENERFLLAIETRPHHLVDGAPG